MAEQKIDNAVSQDEQSIVNNPREEVRTELPSNSFKSREAEEDDRRVKQIISTDRVTTKKKPMGSGFLEDLADVGKYLLHDLIIPTIKDNTLDVIYEGFSRLFYRGDDRYYSRRPRSRRDDRYESYSSYSRDRDRDRDRGDRCRSYRDSERFDIDDIYLKDRNDVLDCIDQLNNLIDKYGEAKVADLYDMVGMRSTHIEQNWGWTNLRGAEPRKTRDGYLIVLPRPIYLD